MHTVVQLDERDDLQGAALADDEIGDLPVEPCTDGSLRLFRERAIVGQERGKRHLREYVMAGERSLQAVEEFGLVRSQERFAP